MHTTAHCKQRIQEKTKGSTALQILWDRVLQKGMQNQVNPDILHSMIQGFDSPRAAERFIDLMPRSTSQKTWDHLCENASLLGVDLHNYLRAVEVFLQHPKTQNIKTSLDKIMGYISCSSESSAFLLDLPQTVEHMLDEFGFANML
jgi:hypothetical protein